LPAILLFILFNLVLVLQFVPFGEVLYADRYMYIPVTGFGWITGIALSKIGKKSSMVIVVLSLVATMHLAKPLAYSESDDWQCVALPFEDTAIRCEIVLPREGVPLATAEAAMLSGDCLGTLRAETVRVALPRFRVAARHGLKSALQALGLRDAFSPGAADFSGMSPKNDLFLSDVVHRTWIDVDENGAEAAAATAAVLEAKSARPGEPKDFIANRPFGFVLRDADTGLILFVGRVSDPRTQQD
jgi:serpin B